MSRELWELEYVNQSISSSVNLRPSHGTEFLRQCMPRIAQVSGPPRMLDLGCGGGRNVEVLEETGLSYYGMDFAFHPLAKARARLGNRLRLVQGSITDPLPFRSGMFSVVTAFTAIENVVEDRLLAHLGAEIARLLCPDGLFYAYFLTVEDSYYRPLIDPDPAGRSLTYDPVTRLRQRVYRPAELSALFDAALELLVSEQFAFEDTRSRGRYQRRLAAGLWKRR